MTWSYTSTNYRVIAFVFKKIKMKTRKWYKSHLLIGSKSLIKSNQIKLIYRGLPRNWMRFLCVLAQQERKIQTKIKIKPLFKVGLVVIIVWPDQAQYHFSHCPFENIKLLRNSSSFKGIVYREMWRNSFFFSFFFLAVMN